MTAGLDEAQRGRLERLVGRARALLESDLAAQAAGRFGIDADGSLADEASLRLDPSGLADRRDIVSVVEHLHSEGNSPPQAVARLLREATFTHLNRLIAIRIAEDLGLLPPSLADGDQSQGYRDVAELAPLLAADETDAYWSYLTMCGDELAGDVPTLVDPRNPLLALAPSPSALRDLVGLFAADEDADLWAAPDCLGWCYQFFNTSEERAAMREASQAPRDSRELAVRNQFFTPRYVVDFLVQNSLGRRLLDADPSSPLIDDLPLLVDPPAEKGEPVELPKVAVLDPACGSGHFLLAAYDLLERAWQYAGETPANAAPHIVGSLWGIDIDPRCAQVASAALLFRARRSCPDGPLPRPNIICARSLPATATGFDDIVAKLPRQQATLVRALSDALDDAPVLGPLLRIEERIEDAIRASIAGTAHGHLAAAVTREQITHHQDELLDALEAVADATTATSAERLLAAEAGDAVRFVTALLRRYDAVVQNPPFGEPVPDTKPYLKATYPWMPARTCDLLAAFVGRGVELCRPGSGYVGAITSRVGMFLSTFEAWRRHVLLGNRLVALADLGHGVMAQALVEAAAYVVGRDGDKPRADIADRAGSADSTRRATFVRLLKETDRPAGLAAAIATDRRGEDDSRIFQVAPVELDAIPGSPIAYWMSPAIRRLFTDHPPVEGRAGDARQGLATGDDFRFVRAFWEVSPARIARSRDETRAGKRWVPFAKGGEYSPYWADVHLVVNWGNDGEELRDYDRSRVQNAQYYFRPGLTWPERTTSGFGLRILPAGAVFSHVGHGAFPVLDKGSTLGMLTSRLSDALLAASLGSAESTRSGSPAKRYSVGSVQRLPWISGIEADATLSLSALKAAELHRLGDLGDETARLFTMPSVMSGLVAGMTIRDALVRQAEGDGLRYLRILKLTRTIDERVSEQAALGLDGKTYLDDEVGPHPDSYGEGPLDERDVQRLLEDPIDRVVDELIERRGGSRAIANLTFFADRRLEVIAHGLECSPAQIEAFRRRERILPKGTLSDAEVDVLSYLVGVAVGRWDLRVVGAPDPELGDLFDPVPIHPPGMLLDGGRPARSTPAGYEFDLPPNQLLLDQPAHPWDLVARVHAASSRLVEDADELLGDVMKHMRGRSLRDHLRKHFFKAHLKRYSKSRRQAPIYWPLYVPSGAWGVWVYAPSLTRETLYAVEAAATARLNATDGEISRLRTEQQGGAGGRAPRRLAELLESEQRLAEELRAFRTEAERVAALGWEPDLDDGIVLCAAPLAELFPAWPEARKKREELRAGKYTWATVARWADEL